MKRKALTRRKPKRTRKEATRRKAGDQPPNPPSPLGNAIRAARTAKGMTQLALAHAIGYLGDDAGAYISRVESNHQAPRIDTLQRIATALGVAMCSLLSKG